LLYKPYRSSPVQLQRVVLFGALGFFVAGCGGGGSPSTPSTRPLSLVTAAPTAAPVVGTQTGASGATGASSYTIESVPAKLSVSIANVAKGTQALLTPTAFTPGNSNFATTISIAPSNGAAPYVFVADQRSDGAHTVLYNQTADTNGSIAAIGALPAPAESAVRFRATSARNVLRIRVSGTLGRPHWSASQLIVHYRGALLAAEGRRSSDVERSEGIARAYDIGYARDGITTRIVDVPAGTTANDLATRLRSHAEVDSVEPELLYYPQSAAAVTPNNPYFNSVEQWDMFRIGAPNAWGYTEGNPSVQIAIIDTGVDTTSPGFSGGKIVYAESVVDGTVTPGVAAVQDVIGHGTNVAGIAAAATNDGFGFAGTGFNVGLQIYKVFPPATAANSYAPSANSSDIAQAIYDAVTHGAKVINLSVGSCQAEGIDTLQSDAVNYALAQGVSVVAASGNDRAGSAGDAACQGGSSTIDFPAAIPGVIAVGASALNDGASPDNPSAASEYVASYSNAGPGLTLVAPGGDPSAADEAVQGPTDYLHWVFNLYSTTVANPNEQCADPTDCTALFAGTSQAVPHVSGVVALMLSLNPALTPPQILHILSATADDIHDPNQGSGRLDAYRALAAAAGDPAPPAAPTNLNFVAFAYVPNGTSVPRILDVTYPSGVPVASDGTFRIADIPANAPSYKIGVWYDANGDGTIDAGDYFGSSQLCTAAAPCTSAAGITVAPVASGFTLQ